MDTLFVNGNIHSLDSKNTRYEAIGVVRDRIVALGSTESLKRCATAETRQIDLSQQTVLPGFIDSHNHLMLAGYLNDAADCASPPNESVDEVLQRIVEAAKETPRDVWVKGRGYTDYKLRQHRLLTRSDLDSACPDRPVVVYHTSYHCCMLNSIALEELEIGPDTPDPPGGEIVRDAQTGEPNGVLHDAAMMSVLHGRYAAEVGRLSGEEKAALCRRSCDHFVRHGITASTEAMVNPLTLSVYHEGLKRGSLSLRANLLYLYEHAGHLIDGGLRGAFGSEKLKIGSVKIFYDGGMSSRTAYFSDPYLVPPYNCGIRVHDPAAFAGYVRRFHGLGFQIAVHAQGDRALGEVIGAFESVIGIEGENRLRHRLEHAGGLFGSLKDRLARIGLLVSSQPAFFSDFGDGYLEALGEERTHQLYPFKSLLRSGVTLGGSSDTPVTTVDPLVGVRDAVLRKTQSGIVMGPDERVTVEEVLRMYTNHSARLSFDEDRMGSLEVEKWADFVVLSGDPLATPPEEIPDFRVKMTVVGGEVAYQA